MDENGHPDTVRFKGLLSSFGLCQHISAPTHVAGHTLDLVITRNNETFFKLPPSVDTWLSDHVTILEIIEIMHVQ